MPSCAEIRGTYRTKLFKGGALIGKCCSINWMLGVFSMVVSLIVAIILLFAIGDRNEVTSIAGLCALPLGRAVQRTQRSGPPSPPSPLKDARLTARGRVPSCPGGRCAPGNRPLHRQPDAR